MLLYQFLLVALGSALGGSLRYAVSFLSKSLISELEFVPTLLVNLIGSFGIGIAFAFSQKFSWSESLSLFLIVGLLGGFTTFSSFSLDILKLLQNGHLITAVSYIFGSLLGGIALAYLGFILAK